MAGASSISGLGKEQRYFALNEQRKVKREDLLMKRRGLNFVTEHHEELLE
jgi:glutamine synthetase type III